MIPGSLNFMMARTATPQIPGDYIARYVAADVAGTTMVDKTGNYSGTISGATKVFGKLLRFDGVNDYVNFPALLARLKLSGAGTVAIHFKAPAGGRGYFALGNTASPAFIQYSVSQTAMVYGYNANAALGVDNFALIRNGTFVVPEKYHKAIFVSDPVNGCKMFFDGVEVVPNANEGTPNNKWWDDNTALNNARLMSLDYGATDQYHKGDIVSVTIYDYAMGAEGIAQLSAEPNPTVISGAMFGDSITAGVGASSYASSWAGLYQGIYDTTNYAVSGDQAADQSKVIQANQVPDVSKIYTLMIGTNDHRQYKTDTAKRAAFKAFFRQCLAWLALPTKKTARSADIATTGTWTNTSVNTIGKNTTGLGAKATATFTGTGVIVGVILQDSTSAQSTVTVKIDGVSVGTIGCYAAMTTVNGSAYAPAAFYFGGLSNGAHTIELENTVSGKIFYLDYIAPTNQAAPKIVVGNIIKMTEAAYSTYGTSEANVIAFNGMISDVIGEFAANGITINVADNYSAIDPVTHLPDGVHPNDAGHNIIYTNMLAKSPQ